MATPHDNHAEHTTKLQLVITPLIEALEQKRWLDVIAICHQVEGEAMAVRHIAHLAHLRATTRSP